MSTSYIGTVIDDLVDGLRVVNDLTAVNIFSGNVTIEEAGTECVAFGRAELTESPHAMGGNRLEEWELSGETRVYATWQGDTETTIRAARDRALEILGDVETYVNDTYTGSLPDVNVTTGSIEDNIGPEGRVCSVLFTLTIRAAKNP